MALFVNARAGAYLDGVAIAAQDLRLQEHSGVLTGASPSGSTGIAGRPGVRPGLGSPLLVQASSGMTITVNAGFAYVQGSASANAGIYTACLDAAATLTVATSDPTNPRIDNVIAQVTDVGSSSSTTVITLQTGTPAPSPVAPALPANSLLLATVAVAANTSTIVAGNITDGRVFTAAVGGIVLMDTSGGFTGQAGMYAHDIPTGRLRVTNGSGAAAQPKVGAFAASTVTTSGAVVAAVGSSSSATTILSTTVTVDGATEIEVWGSWIAILPNASAAVNDQVLGRLYLDGTNITASVVAWTAVTTSTTSQPGGVIRAWTTPSAGTHTLFLNMWSLGHAGSVSFPVLRAAPSLQQ